MSLLVIQIKDNIKLREEATLSIKRIQALVDKVGKLNMEGILRIVFEIAYLVVLLGAIIRLERSMSNLISPQLLITDGREKK
jgi:hypothetical protein